MIRFWIDFLLEPEFHGLLSGDGGGCMLTPGRRAMRRLHSPSLLWRWWTHYLSRLGR